MLDAVTTLPNPLSPLHDALPAIYHDAAQCQQSIAIADLSLLPRYGCKGPAAASWLMTQGLSVPAQPNSAIAQENGGTVARLGMSEYLIEADITTVQRLSLASRGAGVYPVLRQDACLLLCGPRVEELLLQTCNVQFAALDLSASPVVLTSLVGVGVTVLPAIKNGMPCYRLWCDGGYGIYLWQTLTGIAAELGGGPVSATSLSALI